MSQPWAAEGIKEQSSEKGDGCERVLSMRRCEAGEFQGPLRFRVCLCGWVGQRSSGSRCAISGAGDTGPIGAECTCTVSTMPSRGGFRWVEQELHSVMGVFPIQG